MIKNLNGDVFEFNDAKHYYTLNGKRLYGVTNVLSVISKPALIQWAANLATLQAFKTMANPELLNEVKSVKIDNEVAKRLANKYPEFREATVAHRKKSDESAEAGTNTHATIEELVKHAITSNSGVLAIDSHENVQVNHFVNWARKNGVKFLFSELRMYSKTLWVAGTCDLVFEMDGEIFVGDIKTTTGIYDRTPFMQCAAYEMMLKEHNPEMSVKGRYIIRLGKDGTFEVKDSASPLDAEGFLSALSLFKCLEVPISDEQGFIKKSRYKKKHARK